MANGLTPLDAQHVALAWAGGADVLFSTDSDMLAFAVKHSRLIDGMVIVDPRARHEVL
jgi:hypothetical protein